ncbi:MAG: RICIN domain-containing protein, partial [Ruminococcus sp.]|nr:RICIN domain-containing protein [Ruminococcus sp.]
MKTFRRMISIAAAAVISMTSLSALSFTETASAASAAASFSYPVQEFRMGIGDTNCNINITGTESGDYLNGWTINGTDNEKWYLNYISEGVYEIVNTATGYVITNDSGLAVISPDTDAANQRWKISCVEKDFEGYELYFKIVSNADSNKALTFNIDSNSIQVADYTGDTYQKFRLNLDGLEGYAANCSIGGKMKAGTIGG